MIILSYLATTIIILAYTLLSLKIVKNQSKYFYILLLIGNLLFIVQAIENKSYPILFLNIAFGIFSILALFEIKIKMFFLTYKIFYLSTIFIVLLSIYVNFEKNIFIETSGWLSTALGFGIYLLYSQKIASLLSYLYFNILSNITFIIYLSYYENYAYIILQCFIFFISLYGILKIKNEEKRKLFIKF